MEGWDDRDRKGDRDGRGGGEEGGVTNGVVCGICDLSKPISNRVRTRKAGDSARLIKEIEVGLVLASKTEVSDVLVEKRLYKISKSIKQFLVGFGCLGENNNAKQAKLIWRGMQLPVPQMSE